MRAKGAGCGIGQFETPGSERGPDFLVAHDRGNLVLHVAHGDFVMFGIVRCNAVRSQNYRPIPLAGVNGCGANAGVGVDPGQDDRIGTKPGKLSSRVVP